MNASYIRSGTPQKSYMRGLPLNCMRNKCATGSYPTAAMAVDRTGIISMVSPFGEWLLQPIHSIRWWLAARFPARSEHFKHGIYRKGVDVFHALQCRAVH